MKLLFFFICLLFSNLSWAAVTAEQLLSAVKDKTPSQRVIFLSAALLNKPYQLEPLGEGPKGKFNQEPLYRLDCFDCETYVNTILAMAFARDKADIENKIHQINYTGEVNFINRAHFTDCDWIPNNLTKGFIRELTRHIAGEDLALARIFNDRKNWYLHLPSDRIKIANLPPAAKLKLLKDLHAAANAVNNRWGQVYYIPITAFIQHAALWKKIPSGSVLLFIRPDTGLIKQIGTNTMVSHMAFFIWRNGIAYIRHASSIYNKTVDTPFSDYLQQCLLDKKMQGIAIYTLPF